MFTRDRVNVLLRAKGYEELPEGTPVQLHGILDFLDDISAVDTTGGLQYGILSRRLVPINPVGKRIAKHEQLVAKPPPRCEHGNLLCLDKDCDQDCHC